MKLETLGDIERELCRWMREHSFEFQGHGNLRNSTVHIMMFRSGDNCVSVATYPAQLSKAVRENLARPQPHALEIPGPCCELWATRG